MADPFYYLLENLMSEISLYISRYKNDLFIRLAETLSNPSRFIRLCWDTLRTLWDRKDVPKIPSQLINNELILEFETKANMFHKYFCQSMHNNQ